jgi:hypothetical protein
LEATKMNRMLACAAMAATLGVTSLAGAQSVDCRRDALGTVRCSNGESGTEDALGTTRLSDGTSVRVDSFGNTHALTGPAAGPDRFRGDSDIHNGRVCRPSALSHSDC